MAFNSTNPVSVGDPTRKSDYDRAFDNIKSIVALLEGGLDLGGEEGVVVTSTSYVDLPKGGIFIELTDTELSGLSLQLHGNTIVRSGASGDFQLWDITGAAAVASSPTNFTNGSQGITKSATLTLPSGTNEYKVQVKAAASASISAWGFRLVPTVI